MVEFTGKLTLVELLVCLEWRIQNDELEFRVNILCSRPLTLTGPWRRCRSTRPVQSAPGCQSSPPQWTSALGPCHPPSHSLAAWPPERSGWAPRPACWRWTSRGERPVWPRQARVLALSRRACPPWSNEKDILKLPLVSWRRKKGWTRTITGRVGKSSSTIKGPVRKV